MYVAPAMKGNKRFVRDLPVFGNRFRMLGGLEPGISLPVAVGCRQWTFMGTARGGQRVEVTGCDVFTFRDGKIRVKNSCRKNRLPAN